MEEFSGKEMCEVFCVCNTHSHTMLNYVSVEPLSNNKQHSAHFTVVISLQKRKKKDKYFE